ncbi:energy transducer TonB [Kaistella yonginensis]|uniref:energy transducer TonB n=1 Tax=Kaistella yonginensis TaxID=658267 RepID=UPI0025B3E0BC|nr:energy transducer TonB [Kaistella yonginensis]MDN3605984.1 energy transducer TonB [Kaistella yonginensis]
MQKYLLFLLCSSSMFSQTIHEKYPDNQTDYIGGNVQFYKDFQQVLKDKNLEPCADKAENLHFRLVVYPDKSIKYVKSEDPTVETYKCTFELSKQVVKYLKGWNPAEVNGEKVAAATTFLIIPSELFGEIKEGYDPINDLEMAMYEGGIQKFRKKVFQGIDISGYNFTGTFRMEATFYIERDGSMSNIELAQSSGLKVFDDMIITSLSKIKNKWKPGTIHGIPVRYKFRLPIAFAN